MLCCQRITLITRIYLFLPTDSTNITDSCFATSVKSVKSVDFIFWPTDSTNITDSCFTTSVKSVKSVDFIFWPTDSTNITDFISLLLPMGNVNTTDFYLRVLRVIRWQEIYSFAVSSVFSLSFIRSFSLTLKCRSVLSATIFCITLAQAAPLQVLSFSRMLTNWTPQYRAAR